MRALYETDWRWRKRHAEKMESGGGASGGGRYEDKGGGQQVGSLFAEATDNEKMKAVYGNNGFWSWLRYWFLDTENYVTFMLLDKGYYDYDYEKPSERTEAALTAAKSDAELAEELKRIGLTPKPKKKTLTPEQLQAEVMKEERKKRQG